MGRDDAETASYDREFHRAIDIDNRPSSNNIIIAKLSSCLLHAVAAASAMTVVCSDRLVLGSNTPGQTTRRLCLRVKSFKFC